MPSIVYCDPERSRGFYFRPFPDDNLRTSNGTIDLQGMPHGRGAAVILVNNYIRLAALSCRGFGLHTPSYFLLDGPPDCDLPERIDLPSAADPVVLISIDKTRHRPALKLRNFGRQGDDYTPCHLLAFGPQEHHGLESGRTYVAAVTTRVAKPDRRVEIPGLATSVLEEAGFAAPRISAATIFTVQDVHGELAVLRNAADGFMLYAPDATPPRQIKSLAYHASPNHTGKATWTLEATGADGVSQRLHFHPSKDYRPFALNLAAHGTRVYELSIPVPRYVAADGPAASPGWRFLTDFRRTDGIIPFRSAPDGALSLNAAPLLRWKRIVLQVPPHGYADNLIVYDHGTGGSAYCALARPNAMDKGVTRLLPRTAVVSHDHPLFGSGELALRGFPEYLAAYHPIHLAAARDYLRQAALESWYVYRWIENRSIGLPFGWRRALKFGHSLGSVTANLALALHGNHSPFDKVFLSGAGGFFAMYLLHSAWPTAFFGDRPLARRLMGLLGLDPNARELLARAFGLSGEAITQFDEFHPVMMLVQTILDGADPINFVGASGSEHHYWVGTGDWQVPNEATELLIRRKPGIVHRVAATADYDPHYVLFREDAGGEVIRRWVEQ